MDDIVTGESATCTQCGERIYAVIDAHSGVVDWGSKYPWDDASPSDFGCAGSPLNDEEGTGGHNPGAGHTPIGFQTKPTKQSALTNTINGIKQADAWIDRLGDIKDEVEATIVTPEHLDPPRSPANVQLSAICAQIEAVNRGLLRYIDALRTESESA